MKYDLCGFEIDMTLVEMHLVDGKIRSASEVIWPAIMAELFLFENSKTDYVLCLSTTNDKDYQTHLIWRYPNIDVAQSYWDEMVSALKLKPISFQKLIEIAKPYTAKSEPKNPKS